GGSSGIGLRLVNMLTSQGAQVYNASRTKSEEWSDRLIHIPIDVLTNLDLIGNQLPEKLHGLVYAVGSINLKPFSRYTEDDFIHDYKLNVTGAVRTIQLAYRSLRNSGAASIVLISSVAAKAGMPYHASIAAAKGGVEGLALSLAAEFASAISFLLSDESGWISGQVLGIDGGMGNLKTL
ncbi:MAG: SDR family oxidoreductase, partial [Daejeonella sp.]|nr:SDR family oxidoreductase [Daejeonella sp.]